MRISARYILRTALLLVVLASSVAFVILSPPTLVRADSACMTKGGVYVIFVRGSEGSFDAGEATAFKTQLIGTSNTSGALNRPPLLQVPTEWAELGNLDGDYQKQGSLDAGEYPAIGYADWGLIPDNSFMGNYYNSVWTGIAELTQHLNDRAMRCPKESIVIGGYSQGAEVAGYSLMSVSDYTLSHIGFAALYGDPRSSACNQYVRVPRGHVVMQTVL